MDRERQIYESADAYFLNTDSGNWSEIVDAFESGAKWADSHPHWHKYPDEKPPKMEDSDWSDIVLVMIKNFDCPIKAELYSPTPNVSEIECAVEYWYSMELACHIDKEDVLGWMEIPKFEKI